jgi:hypothetical protein
VSEDEKWLSRVGRGTRGRSAWSGARQLKAREIDQLGRVESVASRGCAQALSRAGACGVGSVARAGSVAQLVCWLTGVCDGPMDPW